LLIQYYNLFFDSVRSLPNRSYSSLFLILS
jgi:hypothetical protein